MTSKRAIQDELGALRFKLRYLQDSQQTELSAKEYHESQLIDINESLGKLDGRIFDLEEQIMLVSKALAEAEPEPVKTAYVRDNLRSFAEFSVDSGTYEYEPVVWNTGCVGYAIHKSGSATIEGYLYLNPSTEDEGSPSVFLYRGPDGEPGFDPPLLWVAPVND